MLVLFYLWLRSMSVKPYAIGTVILSVFLSFGCMADGHDQAASIKDGIESVYTDLGLGNCEEHVDLDDPNESTYQFCPGVVDYSLIVRRVGSGRTSIDIHTPQKGVYPLDYQEFVTRHMTQLGARAEWRVSMEHGQNIPIALIVSVNAHENVEEPEQVTTSYLAIAKITPTEICVTDRLVQDSFDHTRVRRVADMARTKPCLEPQPGMVIE